MKDLSPSSREVLPPLVYGNDCLKYVEQAKMNAVDGGIPSAAMLTIGSDGIEVRIRTRLKD